MEDSARHSLHRSRLLLTPVAGAVLASLLFGACQGSERDPPNVILISIDTLRADHLGSYGYAPPTSPRLDEFRKDAVLFDQAIAQAPSTLPSHASMFTSLVPQHHRASHTHQIPLAPEAVTLAEILRDAGYRTLAVTGGAQLDPSFGVSQGFDHYEVHADWKFRDTVNKGLDLISKTTEKPFFLFLHTYEVHHPYTPSARYLRLFESGYGGPLPDRISIDLLKEINHRERKIDASDLQHVMATYDAEIRSMDDAFGVLVNHLKRRALYEDSVIVFTSDHGEEFNEHGFVGWHSHTLFDELLRVPLLVKLPGLHHAGAEVKEPVQGVDIAPSILAAAGIAPPIRIDGREVLSYIGRAPQSDRPALVWRETAPHERNVKWGIRTAQWKLNEGRLFDLSQDPHELHDLTNEYPSVAARLSREAAGIVSARAPLPKRRLEVDDGTRKTLKALGYVN